MPCMSADMYTIIGVGIALAALILNGQAATRHALTELRQEISDLRRGFAALAERVARLEGVVGSRVGA